MTYNKLHIYKYQTIQKRIYFLVLIILSAISLFPQDVEILFIETTDVHGAIFPSKDTKGSLAQVHTFVEQQRTIYGNNTILLDNGDILQGGPEMAFINNKTDQTHSYAEIMNFMRYDAATVGNHDIEPGREVFKKFQKGLNCPWLAANAVSTKNQKSHFQPYHIIERQDVKVVVLGLITPGIPKWLPEKTWESMFFEDMIESASKWVKIIEEKENPDFLIGLFHAGINYNYDGESAEMKYNENASELVAKNVPGFDLVFVGHDHLGWNKKVMNIAGDSVIILGATSRARDVATAKLSIWKNENNTINKHKFSTEIIYINNFPPHPEFLIKFEKLETQIKEFRNKNLTFLKKGFSSKKSFFEPTEFVDIIHQVQLKNSDAEISIASPLAFNKTFVAGNLKIEDIFKFYRYDNLLYTMALTGDEIDKLLEYSYSNFYNQITQENDSLLKLKEYPNGKTSFTNPFYNFDCAAGISYTIDITKPEGEMIEISQLANKEMFDLNKTYTVAINSYRASGGGGHLQKGAALSKIEMKNRTLSISDKSIRQMLIQFLNEKDSYQAEIISDWRIIPDSLLKESIKESMKQLFNN